MVASVVHDHNGVGSRWHAIAAVLPQLMLLRASPGWRPPAVVANAALVLLGIFAMVASTAQNVANFF